MAKTRKRRARKNPTGTLLVNPRHGGKSRRAKRSSSGFSVKGLLRKLSGKRANPSKRKSRAGKRIRVKGYTRRANPLLTNPKRRKSRRHGKRHNPLLTNPKRRRSKSRRSRRHNPLLTNPVRINRRRRHGKRRNPLLTNPGGMLTRVQRGAQGLVSWIPLGIGTILSGAIGLVGSALGGAIGVLPTAYAMPYVAKYIPDMLKPFGYTIAGAVLSGIIKAIPVRLPYKDTLAIGVAAAGGAVDAYRFRHGKSQDLGDYDSLLSGEVGDAEMGDYGDIGDDGAALAAHEYADADLGDAEYMGDGDLSDAEIAAAELGRKHYAKKFKAREKSAPVAEGASEHAGKPGRRHGWLIYWIGFDNFKLISKMDADKRREAIEHMRREAKLAARKLLSEGQDSSVSQAEMSGLLVAA